MRDQNDISDALTRALHSAAEEIEPGADGLAAIRGRTRQSSAWYRRPWVISLASAGLATAATVVAVSVFVDPQPSDPAPITAPSDPAPTASDEPPTPSNTAPASPAPAKVTVPVYYLGDTTSGPRLYREFHQVTTSDPAVVAVREALRGRPADPDYFTPWQDIDVAAVAHENDIITVDLTSDTDTWLGGQNPRIGVHQVVYTVQAALQSTDPVRFTLNGEPLEELLGLPADQPIERADPLDVQALVWITSPTEGAVYDSSQTLHVEGIANVFEANVSWELLRGDRVVRRGFTMTEGAFEFSPFEEDIPLKFGARAPGRYTLRVFEASPEDGRPTFVDTKSITVGWCC